MLEIQNFICFFLKSNSSLLVEWPLFLLNVVFAMTILYVISRVPDNRTSESVSSRLHKIFMREGKIKLNSKKVSTINFSPLIHKLYWTAPCSTIILEKLTVIKLLKKILALYKILMFMFMFTRKIRLNLSIDSRIEPTTSNHIRATYFSLYLLLYPQVSQVPCSFSD